LKYSLTDLIDTQETQKLLENFHNAVGVPAAIIDLEGVVLVTSRWQRACTDFHRVSETTRQRCIASDTTLANELLEGKPFSLYRCLNGLIDAASPIIIEWEHLANMFIGQFFTEKPDMEFFRAQAKEYGFDEKAYLGAMAEIPLVEEATLPAILSFLTSFAVMIASLGLKQLNQVHIERELRETEKDLKRAQAVAKIGSWRINVRQNVLHWSDETYRIFGIHQGKSMTYEEFLASVHAGDREKVDQAWQAALLGKPYDIEHRIIVENKIKWVQEHAELELDEHGALRGGFGTVQDITDRKQVENELLRAKNDWERTFDSVTDLIAIVDKDHRIIRANREMSKRLGIKPEECVGLRCYESLHGSLEPPEFCPHSKTLRDGQEHTAEVHVEQFEGDFLVSTTPLHNEAGVMVGTVHVARDITERKRMEAELRTSRDDLEVRVQERTNDLSETLEKLEQVNRELQDFAYIASHDLQEPLRKIQAFGNLIRDRCKDKFDETEQDYFTRIEDAASRMRLLIQDLLNLSRIGTRPEPMETVDLNNIADEVFQVFDHRFKVNDAVVQVTNLATIEADASQMRQVFQNLIGNALKFRKKGERPRIKVYSELYGQNKCRIYFEDNGIGFDEKYLERIFSPFQRLHGRNEFEGTGMGLAICRKIVDRHGGSITARSTPGAGSKFIVTLPVKKPAAFDRKTWGTPVPPVI
jgi:PAS domain S-box-containing protein